MSMNSERKPEYNVNPAALNLISEDTALRIYSRIVRAREMDLHVIQAVEEKKVIAPVYLSLGQEAIAATLAEFINGEMIFTQHRSHDLYLSIGADLKEFRDELLGLPTGFSGGRAGSSCLRYMKEGIRLIGHHGLIGENVPQAVGASLASGEKVFCTFGDGAAEEDYVLESFGYAVTKKLPILFVCMDNNLSILTTIEERRSWDLAKVANGFGMAAYDISDCPWTLYNIISKWDEKTPLLINARVCRERWHSGIGIDGEREWKRNEIVRNQLIKRNMEKAIIEIEKLAKEEMNQLWKI